METILPNEVQTRLLAGEKLNLIDVREDEEVAMGMIPGAKHIPLGQIPNRLDEISKTEEVILICRSGYRSGNAQQYLISLGHNGCKNMVGGMLEWQSLEN